MIKRCPSVIVWSLFLWCGVVSAGSEQGGKAPVNGPQESPAGDPPAQSRNGSGRTEAIEREKRQKLEESRPEKLGFVEKMILFAEKKSALTRPGLQASRGGFFPALDNLTSGSGLALGPGYRYINIGGGPIDFSSEAMFSYRGYELYRMRFGDFDKLYSKTRLKRVDDKLTSQFDAPSSKETGFSYFADISYRHYPQHDFYGLGPDSQAALRSDYRLTGTSYDGVVAWQSTPWLGLAVRGGLLDFQVGRGEDSRFPNTATLFSTAAAPGLANQPDFFHLGSTVLLDFRDHPGNPRKGGMVGIDVIRFNDLGHEDFDFSRFAFDSRGFIPVSASQVLALRLFASSDQADRGSGVPFYLMHTLGGSDTLRGFDSLRFRDQNLLYLSGEFRWETLDALEMALFYDAGKAFHSIDAFGLTGLERSYGIGLRVKTKERVLFRIDYGRSREGGQLHFAVGPAF